MPGSGGRDASRDGEQREAGRETALACSLLRPSERGKGAGGQRDEAKPEPGPLEGCLAGEQHNSTDDQPENASVVGTKGCNTLKLHRLETVEGNVRTSHT